MGLFTLGAARPPVPPPPAARIPARVCAPELLDSLPPDHPDAIRNRRDLRFVNRFMRNRAWFARTLPRLLRPGEAVLELGAGQGELGGDLIRRGVPLDGLDLWPRPAPWPAGRQWHRTDLMAFDGFAAYPVVMGNLILHQFTAEQLAELGRRVRPRARVIVANEPMRRQLSTRMMDLVGPLLGASHVTLHDSRVSIAAGFVGEELPAALGLDDGNWDYRCHDTLPGAYRMVAVRRE